MNIERISRVEFDWTIQQLAATNMVKLGENDAINLTEAGLDYCLAYEQRMAIGDRLLMLIFFTCCTNTEEDNE